MVRRGFIQQALFAVGRRFSTSAVDPAEAKAEARLIRIGVASVPIIALAGISSFTVHSPNAREIIDSYIPKFGMT